MRIVTIIKSCVRNVIEIIYEQWNFKFCIDYLRVWNGRFWISWDSEKRLIWLQSKYENCVVKKFRGDQKQIEITSKRNLWKSWKRVRTKSHSRRIMQIYVLNKQWYRVNLVWYACEGIGWCDKYVFVKISWNVKIVHGHTRSPTIGLRWTLNSN